VAIDDDQNRITTSAAFPEAALRRFARLSFLAVTEI
jgi:hypothetical protein